MSSCQIASPAVRASPPPERRRSRQGRGDIMADNGIGPLGLIAFAMSITIIILAIVYL